MRFHLRLLVLTVSAVSLQLTGCASTPRTLLGRSSHLNNPAAVHLPHAKLHEQAGNLDEAKESYQIVLKSNPKQVEAIIGVARIDQLAGRMLEAEQGMKKAIQLSPNDAHVLDSAGQFYASQDRWPEAIRYLDRAVLAAPNEKTPRYHLGVALAESGDTEGALRNFSKSVGDAQAHYNVGYILYQKGQLQAAEQQFVQSVIKQPELQNAKYWLDTVRREQQAGLMMSSNESTHPSLQQSIPAKRPAQSNTAIGTTLPNDARRVLSTSHTSNPASSVIIQGQQGMPQSPTRQNNYPPNLTPQQIEQMRNQRTN